MPLLRKYTRASRRNLLARGSIQNAGRFGFSPDGRTVIVAEIEHQRSLKMAEKVLERRR